MMEYSKLIEKVKRDIARAVEKDILYVMDAYAVDDGVEIILDMGESEKTEEIVTLKLIVK